MRNHHGVGLIARKVNAGTDRTGGTRGAATTIRFRILGNVEIESDGQPTSSHRRQERCVLGILLLNAQATVTVDRLCGLVWDGNPPVTARRILSTHIARIRASLRDIGASPSHTDLQTRRDGYRLVVDPSLIDEHQFRMLLAQVPARIDLRAREALLAQAIALWRGPALHDAASPHLRERLCVQLDELKLRAEEEAATVGLALGRSDTVAARLALLTEQYPARERIAELHMRALHAGGRNVEALAVYERLRRHLAEQFGLDPAAQVHDVYLELLRGDPLPSDPALAGRPAVGALSGALPPAQLPPAPARFVGRQEHLAQLDALTESASRQATSGAAPSPSPSPIAMISGMPGVGKTALAVHWAHRRRQWYPDGQLVVDLRGYAARAPMEPIEALTFLLAALGVPPGHVPVGVDQATGMYRSLLAERRVLVLLDNAHSAEQVRPLLPPAAGSMTIVTSRNRLSGLIALDGARPIAVPVLSPEQAGALLVGIFGRPRVEHELAAAHELVATCAGLPLALSIAGTYLCEHPGCSIADYVARLRSGNLLSWLQIEGDDQQSVRAMFDLSYGSCRPPARRLFRLLGPAPEDVTVAAAATLADISPPEAAALLDQLAMCCLLTETAAGRYTCHNLLRLYARERCELEAGSAAPDGASAAEELAPRWNSSSSATPR